MKTIKLNIKAELTNDIRMVADMCHVVFAKLQFVVFSPPDLTDKKHQDRCMEKKHILRVVFSPSVCRVCDIAWWDERSKTQEHDKI